MLDRFRGAASRRRMAVVLIAAGALVGAVTACGTSAATSTNNKEKHMTSQRPVAEAASLQADLAKVSRTRVFFGHQSVGMNILAGAGSVYAAHGMPAPPVGEGATDPGRDGGFIDHAFIGENGQPLLKIQDFAAKLRSGLGDRVDVATMKLCYVDITSATDVRAVFGTYRTTMAALQREFPHVTFIHATVPLTTQPGSLSKLKSLLTGSGSAADNAARERFNALMRQQHTGDHLVDLAAAESTAPDGARMAGTYGGQRYYVLYEDYSSDGGHLNPYGARVVATAWLTAIARASHR